MTAPIYLDYNATAPLLPQALERMQAALTALPGNPSSPHRFGQAARDALETARARVAELLGFARREVLFTSGGSEANNAALRWLAEARRAGPVHLITSPIEHPSILRTCEWLQGQGVGVSLLPVRPSGVVEVEAVASLLRPETRMVSLMAANNETGVIQPLQELAALMRDLRPDVLLHTDAVQAAGRIELPLARWGYQAVTVAAHKLGGPKGIGALVLTEQSRVPALVLGGKQERGWRAGTESVALAEGFAAAAEWVVQHREGMAGRLTALRERLIGRLAGIADFFLNGAEAPRLPNTANLGFEGVSAQSLLVGLDLAGVAVSTGSACSSGSIEPSPVLMAMGLPEARVRSSLRISLGWATQPAEIDRCAEVLTAEVDRLRRLARSA